MLARSILPALWALLAALSCVGEAAATAAPAQPGAERAPRRERVEACSWDRPGHNPFMGNVVAAIDRYSDIPTDVRVRLKQRMQARQYDEIVDIRRDSISGRAEYQPTIRDMHFGLDRVCAQVSRSGWTAQMHERGLVYCESGHCILVPTVCRNVSRIERAPAAIAGAPAGDAPVDAGAPQPRPTDTSSERYAGDPDAPGTARPQATSSFAEAVAGAALALFPLGDDAGALGSEPGLGGDVGVPFAGLPAGGSGPSGGNGGGSGSGGSGGPGSPFTDSGRSFLAQPPLGNLPGSFDGGGLPDTGLPGTITPVPEPATWASLLIGLALVWRVSARRAARRSAAAMRAPEHSPTR